MIKKKIIVKLGKRSYPIFIGENLILEVGKIIESLGKYSKIIIVTDNNVSKYYLQEFKDSLKSKKVESVVLPFGEKTKSFYYLELLSNKILSFQIDRNTLLIALGGGVVGDLVGLVSSLVLRGLPFIQVPTTLLAQVDSAVGGKTAINTKYGKNLVGTFKQPIAVISSLNTLRTLKKRELTAGYAEVIKYALIADKKFFNWLIINGKDIINLNPNACSHAIKTSCLIKAKIVSKDEEESGVRALLNLGHTFGHAIESINKFSNKILHGEAVLIGIILAIKLSVKLNLCKPEVLDKCQKHFGKLNLQYNLKDFKIKPELNNFLELLKFDKKTKNGNINFILIKNIGEGIICDSVKNDILSNFVKKEIINR